MPSKMSETGNRVVLITGGSRGIGFGAARVMGRGGWKVGISGTSEKALAAASARLAEDGIEHYAVAFRVEDADAWSGPVDAVEQALGPVSALVGSAGISPKSDSRKDILGLDDASLWQHNLDANLSGVLTAFPTVAPRLFDRGD